MPTWFAGVIGIPTVHNQVIARALGCASYPEIMFGGNTLAVLNKHDPQTLKIGSSAIINIRSTTNQGIYVFSDYDGGFDYSQNPLNIATDKVTTIGAAVQSHGGSFVSDPATRTLLNVQDNVPLIKDTYPYPAVSCAADAQEDPANPGHLFPGNFPGSHFSSGTVFPPFTDTFLYPGVYCLDSDIKMTGNVTLQGIKVSIYQRSGSITVNGGVFNLSANTDVNAPLRGLLIYLPVTNNSDVKFLGGGDVIMTGTIMAPSSVVNITGGSTTQGTYQTQVVADKIVIGGNGLINLTYDADSQYQPPVSAVIQLLK